MLTAWLAYRLWDRHDCIDLSAAFAYHTLQSIFPILLISLSLASRILGSDEGLAEQVMSWGELILPESSRVLVQSTLLKLYSQRAGAGVLGVSILLITASNAYLTLQRGADRLWGWRLTGHPSIAHEHLPVSRLAGLIRFLLLRFKALLLVSVAGIILVIDQMISNTEVVGNQTIPGILGSIYPRLLKTPFPVSGLSDFVFSLLVFTLVGCALLRWLPSRQTSIRPLLPGALLIGLAYTLLNAAVGKSLLSLGSRFQAYGVISGVLVLTLWVWLLGLILYYGIAVSVVVDRRRREGHPHLF